MINKLLNSIRNVCFTLIVLLSYQGFAQAPPPPGGSSGTGNIDDNRNGRGAPIGSGLLLFIGLGGIYGGYKIKKENQ
jgi:hypothetical protein